MAKVTVLTAVYNAERYLRPCLDSLKNQTLTDCQFICIDDCSTDSSYDILQEYAKEDLRFQVLRTPVNSGQAKARNLGVQFAKGKYMAMLDADDWYAPETLEQACRSLEETGAQCTLMELVLHYEEDGREELYPLRSTQREWSGEEAFRLSLDWSLHGVYVATADLYKRFPYDDSCRLYSDDNTTRLHYLNSDKVVCCKGRYYYRQHPASMTTACSIRRFDYMPANLSMKRQLEALPLADMQGILDFYERHRWLNLVDCYWYYRLHRNAFHAEEHQQIQELFAQMLQTIEPQRIPWSLKGKLGYYPFRSYRTFCFWEDLYFRLRELVGR
jgi:glycosyltransferase involved in cell wall biosynthesis